MVTMVGSYRLEVLDCSLGQLAQFGLVRVFKVKYLDLINNSCHVQYYSCHNCS